MSQGSRYRTQRKRHTPPYVPLKYVRLAAGLTLDQVAAKIKTATGSQYTAGALSAMENGLRGVSSDLLTGLEIALSLPAGTIQVDYIPRAPRGKRARPKDDE